ncbi:MAG: sigma-70 family RNA polymerase sigma factor [candidate division WOR-3 bacterium]
MNFEEYLKEINIKILNFCKEYNFLHHKDDLLGEAFLCFKKCKEKFKGDEREFKNYFLKSLDNHFLNYLKRETKLILKENEELEMLNEVKNEKFLEDFERILYRLKDEELWIISLIKQGFNLKEISKKLNISYERVKDIFSEIKSKINPDKRSRKELRRKWLVENEERVKEIQRKWKNKNPHYFIKWRKKNKDYHKNWRSKIPFYMRKYMSLRRLLNKDFLNVIYNFLKFLCKCEKIELKDLKKNSFSVELNCKDCLLNIFLFDDLEIGKIKEESKIVIFSNINSLKNPENQLRCKRIYLFEGREFLKKIEYSFISDLKHKKILIITKSQIR